MSSPSGQGISLAVASYVGIMSCDRGDHNPLHLHLPLQNRAHGLRAQGSTRFGRDAMLAERRRDAATAFSRVPQRLNQQLSIFGNGAWFT